MSKMFQNVPNSAVVNQVLNEELQMTDVISMLKKYDKCDVERYVYCMCCGYVVTDCFMA